MRFSTALRSDSVPHAPVRLLTVSDRLGSTCRGLARERRSGRNGHHYQRCTLTVVTNLTGGYADYGRVVRLVAGVQSHGSSRARSSRLLMRGSRERMSRRIKIAFAALGRARGFALNGDRFCRVLVCNHNVDAARVSERLSFNQFNGTSRSQRINCSIWSYNFNLTPSNYIEYSA